MAKIKIPPKKRKIIIVSAILLILLGYFLFTRFMPMRVADNPIVLPSDSMGAYQLSVLDNQLIVANSKGIMCYDGDGEYDWDCAVKTASPFMEIAEETIVLADTGNSEIHILQDGKVKKTIRESHDVAGIAVNQNSYVAVVTKEPGYKSVVKVYNKSGKCVYQWFSGHIYVTAVALSQNDNYMVVSGINPEAKDMATSLYFFDLSKEKPLGEAQIKDALAFKIIYANKEAYVLTEKGLYRYTKDGKRTDTYDFEGRRLNVFCMKNQDEMAIALSRTDASGVTLSGSEIVVFDDELDVESSTDTDFMVSTIDCNDGFVAAAGLNKVMVLRNNGSVMTTGTLKNDCETICLFEDGDRFATLSEGAVYIYELEYDF
ncbi:MAG: hypothetical protein IKJ55_04820 [Clostridia bacterium]|nr:hypothetical protein [Clostridia bacterium]